MRRSLLAPLGAFVLLGMAVVSAQAACQTDPAVSVPTSTVGATNADGDADLRVEDSDNNQAHQKRACSDALAGRASDMQEEDSAVALTPAISTTPVTTTTSTTPTATTTTTVKISHHTKIRTAAKVSEGENAEHHGQNEDHGDD